MARATIPDAGDGPGEPGRAGGARGWIPRISVVVPGYGLAVAQAQRAIRELADLLQGRGADVRYAIRPSRGACPGT